MLTEEKALESIYYVGTVEATPSLDEMYLQR